MRAFVLSQRLGRSTMMLATRGDKQPALVTAAVEARDTGYPEAATAPKLA